MSYKSDIEIAQESTPLKITEVAKIAGIPEEYLEQYGITVVRIPNNEVNQNFTGVCEYIDNYINSFSAK